MDNKLKLCGDYTTWSNVPFEDIVDRVSAQKKSSNLPMQKYKLICNILIFSMLFPIIYMKRDKLGTKFIQK